MRPIITEQSDLFSYTKRSSAIYRGVLNLLGYEAQGLKDWNSTHKITMSMDLEDHHIYPRAYIASKPRMVGMDQNEAEQLVDSVVNRTLIPKILNIQIGKKTPVEYMSELRQKVNPKLADCLPSHLIPIDMIIDETWNSHFKLFLEERAERLFDLMKHYTTEVATEMAARYGSQAESSQEMQEPVKPRLKDLIAEGKVLVGERAFTRKRPDQFATIIDGDTVEFEGKQLPINTWGQHMTGWSSISIYNSVFLERTGQPLRNLR